MEVEEEVQVSLVEQQRRSLPGDLVTLMDSATVSAITHRVPVSKEKLRNRPPPTLWEVSCRSLCQQFYVRAVFKNILRNIMEDHWLFTSND